LLKLSW